jgi:hypothetical protein
VDGGNVVRRLELVSDPASGVVERRVSATSCLVWAIAMVEVDGRRSGPTDLLGGEGTMPLRVYCPKRGGQGPGH